MYINTVLKYSDTFIKGTHCEHCILHYISFSNLQLYTSAELYTSVQFFVKSTETHEISLLCIDFPYVS